MNSQINNNLMTNPFTIGNFGNINNKMIDLNKQIRYGAVNNNQLPGTQNIPNIIPIMKTNQRSISPPLSHYRSNAISSPQNGINPSYFINGKGIIYNYNQRINPNHLQKNPIQNNFNNNNQIVGNTQKNFIPTKDNRLSNFNSLINQPYRTLLSQRKMETTNPTYNVNIGSFISFYTLNKGKLKEKEEEEKNQQTPFKKIDPEVIQKKIEEKIENENKNMFHRQWELRNQVPDLDLYIQIPNNLKINGQNINNQNINEQNIGNQNINNDPIINNHDNLNPSGNIPINPKPFNQNFDNNQDIQNEANANNVEQQKIEENKKNEKINAVLEDMCIYGNIAQMKIKEEKKENNPKKIIKTEDALTKEKEKKEKGIFALGLISSILERNDIETVIETGENGDDYEDMAITSLQFLTNGLIGKKKYELIFDFEEDRVNELLFNSQKYEEFKDTLRSKISEDYNVPKEKIIIAFPQKGSFHVQVIFQSDEFNDLDLEEFKLKFQKDTKYKELSKLKSVQSGLIMGGCRLSKLQLDPKGNRFYGWPIGETRGGEPYEAPEGWIGIGLNVFDKFWDDRWLDMKNLPGEWVVAYHGVGSGLSADEVKGIPGAIIGMGFKAGRRQAHKDCDDQFHPGQKVGEGVYCTPSIKVAEAYAGVCIIRDKKYKTVIMSRVNPKARRHCNRCEESRKFKYWVVNGTTDEIRPYRILYKRC